LGSYSFEKRRRKRGEQMVLSFFRDQTHTLSLSFLSSFISLHHFKKGEGHGNVGSRWFFVLCVDCALKTFPLFFLFLKREGDNAFFLLSACGMVVVVRVETLSLFIELPSQSAAML